MIQAGSTTKTTLLFFFNWRRIACFKCSLREVLKVENKMENLSICLLVRRIISDYAE
jgi:hypothetical protein